MEGCITLISVDFLTYSLLIFVSLDLSYRLIISTNSFFIYFFNCMFDPKIFEILFSSSFNSLSSFIIFLSCSFARFLSLILIIASYCLSENLYNLRIFFLGLSSFRMIVMILSKYLYTIMNPSNI